MIRKRVDFSTTVLLSLRAGSHGVCYSPFSLKAIGLPGRSNRAEIPREILFAARKGGSNLSISACISVASLVTIPDFRVSGPQFELGAHFSQA
ncbi:MAG: hypothetical protein JSS72_06005 [Armatimonadetes bacterium]|nr:hypothetical protein [Armatimonadota bacterium]